MTLEQIKLKIQSDDYSFLHTNEHLGKNIALLTLGGSHAYGTETDTSDLDIRGMALNRKEEILTNANFEQFLDNPTDTCIYSFNKLIQLLSNCNPNTIEILGCKPEHYLYVSSVGKELLDNAELFLSKRAIHSFCGYANQQLRRLTNKSARSVSQSEQEQHILNTIKNAMYDIKTSYQDLNNGSCIDLYIDKAVQDGYDTEIYIDTVLKHYPLRDYKSIWSEMQSIVKSYSKVGRRNEHAIEHGKLGKHMMHLIRLYMMCLDILENKSIVTYREKEHDFLMDIRNGKYLDSNRQPISSFFDIVDEYERKLEYAKKNTDLPDNPNYKKINEFVMSVNERVVLGKV